MPRYFKKTTLCAAAMVVVAGAIIALLTLMGSSTILTDSVLGVIGGGVLYGLFLACMYGISRAMDARKGRE